MARTPRMNRYERQIMRLYESIIFLDTVCKDKVIGSPRFTMPNKSNLNDFLGGYIEYLAHMCDFDKGGDSTTAIGLEDQKERNIFWIAQNHDPHDRAKPFLEKVLNILKESLGKTEEQKYLAQHVLFELYVQHAHKRVHKEAKNLNKAIRKCKKALANSQQLEDRELLNWLAFFEYSPSTNLATMCETAYKTRNTPQKERLGKRSRDNALADDIVRSHRETNHYLNCLMRHFKVTKSLVEESEQVRDYIEESCVARVPPMLSHPRPQADAHTSLESILGRMVSSRNDEEWKTIESNLARIDRLVYPSLEARIKDKYEDANFQPCIHAEIQVLDFFHRNKLVFARGHRFIACSKPACICCRLYFQHHPARPVEPNSHEKIMAKWSPPLLPKGKDDERFKEQQKLISSVIIELKSRVIDLVLGRVRPLPFQYDSITAMTELGSDKEELYDSFDEGELCSSSDDDEYEDSPTVIFDRGEYKMSKAR
jgi:hypothetical protein